MANAAFLKQFLSEHASDLLKIGAVSLVAGFLSIAPTVYMMEVYGLVITSHSMQTLLSITILLLVSLAAVEFIHWAALEASKSIGNQLDRRFSPKAFSIIYRANARGVNVGGQLLLNDIRSIRDFMSSPAMVAIFEVPISVLFLALLFYIHLYVGLLTVVGGLIQLFIVYYTDRTVRPNFDLANIKSNAAMGYLFGGLRNAQVVKAMGMRNGIKSVWMARHNAFLLAQARASDDSGALSTTAKILTMAHGSAGLGIGFWLMLQGELAHGGVAIFGGILGGKVLTPLVTIVAGWRQVGDAISSYKRLNQVFQDFPEGEKGLQLPAPEGNVSVEGLVAGPPGVAINILKGLTFRVPKGHIVAVVGPSASGKTSLARLLVGVWGPTAGAVRLDGADVYHWPKDNLGQHVGYLPQDVELFEGSIAQNIARFGEVDDDKLAEALTIAGLQDLIQSLPDGADTIVGGDGGFLSGGEKQKVALARAVYGRPPLIVLDEPNSSLDEAGDQQLNQAMLIAKSWGSTVFVITHRNSVLPVVDLLLVLQDGNLRLFGPRDEVLRALQGGGAPS